VTLVVYYSQRRNIMVGPNAEPQTPELSTGEKLQWCLENLGQRITTVAVSPETLDARVVRQWVAGPESIPEVSQTRAVMLYDAARRIADVYDDQTARAFLRGSNPYAGDRSLLEVIGVEEPEQAREIVDGAVSVFLE
jgi:hypothetical protein